MILNVFFFFQFQIESPLTSFISHDKSLGLRGGRDPTSAGDGRPRSPNPPPRRLRSVSSFTWEAGLWVSAAVMEARSQRGRPHLSLTSRGERGGVGSGRGRGVPPRGQSPPQSPLLHTHTLHGGPLTFAIKTQEQISRLVTAAQKQMTVNT